MCAKWSVSNISDESIRVRELRITSIVAFREGQKRENSPSNNFKTTPEDNGFSDRIDRNEYVLRLVCRHRQYLNFEWMNFQSELIGLRLLCNVHFKYPNQETN